MDGQAMTAAPATLRAVKWCNTWNRIRANYADGAGTKTHLTASPGVSGTTLCGKSFPRDKGYPSSWGAGYCKKCLKYAKAMGLQDGFTRALTYVPSVEDWCA